MRFISFTILNALGFLILVYLILAQESDVYIIVFLISVIDEVERLFGIFFWPVFFCAGVVQLYIGAGIWGIRPNRRD